MRISVLEMEALALPQFKSHFLLRQLERERFAIELLCAITGMRLYDISVTDKPHRLTYVVGSDFYHCYVTDLPWLYDNRDTSSEKSKD